MSDILFFPLNQNHVLVFNGIIKALNREYLILCHDKVSEAEQYHTEGLLKKLKLKYIHFNKGIDTNPNDSLIKKILSFYRIKKQIRNILRDVSPKVLVLALDNDPLAITAIKESKRIGIKTILVSEGLLKPYEFEKRKKSFSDNIYALLGRLGLNLAYIQYGLGGCDKILVSGRIAYNILKKTGVQEDKMKIVGQQKYDSFLEKIRDLETIENDRKVFLYAASTRIVNFEKELEFVRKLSRLSERARFHLIVKLHPRLPEGIDDVKRLIKYENGSSSEIIKEGYDTFNILRKVDVVITISSAIVLEALMMDKECISVDYLAGRRRFNYGEYDAIYAIESENDIESVIMTCMNTKKDYEKKRRLLEDEIYKLDFKSGERAAKEIEEMIF